MLERRPRIGTFVRHTEPEELSEMYDIRFQLETVAARRAATKINHDELACLRALVRTMECILADMRENPGLGGRQRVDP